MPFPSERHSKLRGDKSSVWKTCGKHKFLNNAPSKRKSLQLYMCKKKSPRNKMRL